MTKQHHNRRVGYTLVELIFSIAFLTSISAISLAGFVNIFGLFNKAQSLSRTQEETRNAMDVLVRDLRTTTSIQGFDSSVPGQVTVVPAASLFAANATNAVTSGNGFTAGSVSKDAFCLIQGDVGKTVGYVLILTGTGNGAAYRLFRTDGCWNLDKIQQLTSQDVWSDTGTGAFNTTALSVERRPLVIAKVAGGANDSPIVWQVKVAVHRGTRVPGVTTDGLEDRFSAETVLQATVNTRE